MTTAATQYQTCTLMDIEQVLLPGTFIPASDMPAFVGGVRALHVRLKAMTGAGHAPRAVKLYETFLAAFVDKAPQCKDPKGLLPAVFRSLFCGWISARQKAALSPKETVWQVVQWLACMEHDRFELPVDTVAKALDRRGYSLLVDHYSQMLHDSLKRRRSAASGAGRYPPDHVPWPADELRAIYGARGDIQAYAVLAELIGLTSQDCLILATMAKRQKHLELALDWIERGLELDRESPREHRVHGPLESHQISLLVNLGRIDEARRAAWRRFAETCSIANYQALMEVVPEDKRRAWRYRAVMVASKRASMELLFHCEEWSGLAAAIRGRTDGDIEIFASRLPEKAWARLAREDAVAVARLHVAIAFRILGQETGIDHTHALCHLKDARDLYRKVGDQEAWTAVVKRVEGLPSDPQNVKPRFAHIAAWESGGRLQFFRDARSIWHATVDPLEDMPRVHIESEAGVPT